MNLKVFQIQWVFVVFHQVHMFLCHTLAGSFPVSDGIIFSSPHPDSNDPKVMFLPWSCCDGEFRPIEGKISPFATKLPTNSRENEISILETKNPSSTPATGISMLETQTEACYTSQSPGEITPRTEIQDILASEIFSTATASPTTIKASSSESSHTQSFETSMISTLYEEKIANTTTTIDRTDSFIGKTTFVDFKAKSTALTTESDQNSDKFSTNYQTPSTIVTEISESLSTGAIDTKIPSTKIIGPDTVVEESLEISSTEGSSYSPTLITMPLTESSRQGVSVTDIEQEGPSETYPTSSYSTNEPDQTSEGGYTEDPGIDSFSTDSDVTQPDQESSSTDFPMTEPGQGSSSTDFPMTEPGQGSIPTDYPGSTQVGPSSENPTDYPMTSEASQPGDSTPEGTDNPTDSDQPTDPGSETTRPTETTRQPPGTSTSTNGPNFSCVKFPTVEDWQNDLSLRALKLRSTLIRVRFIGVHTAQQAQSIMRGVYWLNGLSRSLRRSRFSWTRNLYGNSKLLRLLRCESSFNIFGQRVSGMLWQRRLCCFGGFIFSCGTI